MVVVNSMVPLLGAVFMMFLPCSAFTADRSVNIPTGWNIVPLLETEQKVTVDHFSNEKTPATSLDRVLQPSDTKKSSTQSAEQTAPQDTERDRRYVVLENVDSHFTETVKDPAINEEITIADTMGPRNVILLLVVESDQERKDLWKKDFRVAHSFPVEGQLQSCHNTKIEGSWFTLDKAIVSGSKDTECDCEHYLLSNVATLLLWARDVKGMTTGTLFNASFTIPSMFGYEEPASVPGELDELDENMKLTIHKAKPEIRSDWYMIDLGKPVNHASSGPFAPINREEGTEDSAWNVFDMFSRIRMALFRSLLEALGRNVAESEEPIPFGRSHPSPSNLADIVSELKSIQNRKGFVLVAVTPASELDSAMATLQREVSQDMLVVVAGVCTRDAKPIPFFAKGPAAKMLHEAITIWDLPTTIRNIIANGYQDPSCRIRRHDANPLPAEQLTTVSDKEAVSEKILPDPEKIVQTNANKTETTSVSVQTNASNTNASSVTDDHSKEVGDTHAKVQTNASSSGTRTVAVQTTASNTEVSSVADQVTVSTTDTSSTTDDHTKMKNTLLDAKDDHIKMKNTLLDAKDVHFKKVTFFSPKKEKKDASHDSPSIVKAENLASSDMKATKFTAVFGTVTSILVTFILAS